MSKLDSLLLRLIIFSILINSPPQFLTAQTSITKISWQENVFFPNLELKWQYVDVKFNGDIDVVCPCENDSITIIIDEDLSKLNLVTDDINKISSSITQLINSQDRWIIVNNSTLLLDLDGIPFIYPVITEYSNGTAINRLEEVAINSPRTNYTDIEYAIRNVEDGTYVQWNVFSDNPWWRFQTKIDVKTGIMTSLWLEEGFFSLVGGSFSRVYNLTLVSDLPNLLEGSNYDNEIITYVVFSITLILILIVVKLKFKSDPI